MLCSSAPDCVSSAADRARALQCVYLSPKLRKLMQEDFPECAAAARRFPALKYLLLTGTVCVAFQ